MPKVNKTLEEVKKKAEKYVRANSIYYGNDDYRMNMKDWLYFVEGLCNEVTSQTKQETIKQYSSVRNKLIDMYRERKGITIPNELAELALKLIEKKTKQELIEDIKKALPSHPDGMISRNEVKKILDNI